MNSPHRTLEGKVIVIIGGSTGLGSSAARACVRAGARVVITGRNAESLAAAGAGLGEAGATLAGDARDPDHAPAAIRLARDQFGGFQLLQEIQQWKDGIDSAKLQLALLLGKTPDYAASIAVPAAPVQGLTLPPENLPLHLIARKPEIVAARWRVEAADAGIAQAKANFYPDINISAFAGLSSLGLDHLLKSGSAIAGAGPVLSLPVFDGGRLRASLSRNVAEYDTAVYSYNQSLQSAFKDAAEQVQSLQKLNEQRKIAESARRSATQLQQLATLRQRAGTGTALPVLQAEINEVGQKKNLNDIQSKMTLSQIALIRAIGGDVPASN